MAKARQRERWELAAEELVRQVRLVLDYDADLDRLDDTTARDHARARLKQLERLCEAMELELWQVATQPTKTIVSSIARGLQVGLKVMMATVVTLGTTDLYHAVTTAHGHAEHVVHECQTVDNRGTPNPAERPVQHTARAGTATSTGVAMPITPSTGDRRLTITEQVNTDPIGIRDSVSVTLTQAEDAVPPPGDEG